MAINIDILELKPPPLEFGVAGDHFDPRIGLFRAGPFSLRFGRSHKARIRVAMVGPSSMLDRTLEWLERSQKFIPAAKVNPMYVDFPGFENAFQSVLVLDKLPRLVIDAQLSRSQTMSGIPRFDAAVAAYVEGVAQIKDSGVDVILCCIPPEIVTTCRTVSRTLTPVQRARIRAEKRREDSGQLMLDNTWYVDPDPESLLQRDFRRALKAGAMQYGVPTQVVTNGLIDDDSANQDAATRAWNVNVAMFYKAGGIPWRLRLEGPETCFVGLSFHHLRTSHKQLVYSSVAQAFSSDGEGFALRGEAVVPPERRSGRTLHLSKEQAKRLGFSVIAEYRDRTGRNPARVVFHKTTMFDDEERVGLRDALDAIPVVEFVNVAPADFRLVQRSAYPPKRGTLCRVNGASFLFTTGFVPEWNTYPGAHVPAPVRVRTDRGVDVVRAAIELLGLARMNWNTAFDTSGAPITLRFSREIGGIMSELLNREAEPSYRFYM